ncbi:MAG: malto-oligosyltrehalose trehalohydrolase [Desulfobacteraceae bacterium]
MRPPLGAAYLGDGRCRFMVWAPLAQAVEVRIVYPDERVARLKNTAKGYHHIVLNDVDPAARYLYRLYFDQTPEGPRKPAERPDPASRYQPDGVHGPSRVVTSAFDWQDGHWFGIPLSQYIIYELHVGTFSTAGTFDGVIAHLDRLAEIGITAVELMPVAQFPGNRNWGYDGTYPFAVQNSYGGPQSLKRLVDACHRKGLAVVLDVVYNHLGPEGNYLRDFGPYFTDVYRSPWGQAVNFDGSHSDEVRRFFIENALYWIGDCHIDALRIDAVHAILDFTARPFLEQLALEVHREAKRLNRRIYCIAESALNDTRVIRPRQLGGFGLDAQWNDDFHHALHSLLTGEKSGYYQDFGRLEDLAMSWREGFVYAGRYSGYRRRSHGNSSRTIPARQFVVFSQNHDQVGNRMQGERLARLVNFEQLKLAAGVVLLSPFIPLLFMGEEYGEVAPFQYFISHTDPDLVEDVRQGRRREFAAFGWQQDPPDPQDEATFLQAKLNHALCRKDHHQVLMRFHRELIRLRKANSCLAQLSKKRMHVFDDEQTMLLCVRRWSSIAEAWIIFHFGCGHQSISISMSAGPWIKALDSAEKQWQGPGSRVAAEIESKGEVTLIRPPYSVLVLTRERNAI